MVLKSTDLGVTSLLYWVSRDNLKMLGVREWVVQKVCCMARLIRGKAVDRVKILEWYRPKA